MPSTSKSTFHQQRRMTANPGSVSISTEAQFIVLDGGGDKVDYDVWAFVTARQATWADGPVRQPHAIVDFILQ
jgi:hypothetical protein